MMEIEFITKEFKKSSKRVQKEFKKSLLRVELKELEKFLDSKRVQKEEKEEISKEIVNDDEVKWLLIKPMFQYMAYRL